MTVCKHPILCKAVAGAWSLDAWRAAAARRSSREDKDFEEAVTELKGLGLAEHLQGDHSDGDRFEVVSAPPRGRTCSTQV